MKKTEDIKNDRKVLRKLGRIIRDISSDPVNEERKTLWKELNGLKRVRPPVLIYEIPWNEMEHENELQPLCQNLFLQKTEISMRRIIYQWRHMPCDMVVEGYIGSPDVIANMSTMLKEDVDIVRTDPSSGVVSRHFNIQISTEDDIEKINMPALIHNEKESEKFFNTLSDIFDGILPVLKTGVKVTSAAPWDELVRFTGIEPILMDMVFRPDYVHKAISRMTNVYLERLKQLEQLNLLSLNNDNSHFGGGLNYTDELPQKDFINGHVRPVDMWGRTTSQIFSSVSPAMHEEFALQYELKYLSQFGLTYYGCCEPLHKKIDILRKVPNLRKISMSPWVNTEEGAERIGKNYVYSMKPNPACLSGDTWNPQLARKELEDNLRKTMNCPTEIIMKDISTVSYQPERLWEWARIAAEVALCL